MMEKIKTMIILFSVCFSVIYLFAWVLSGKYHSSPLNTKSVPDVNKQIGRDKNTIEPVKY